MDQRRYIRERTATPSTASRPSSGLPTDLQQAVGRRLAAATLVYAVTYLILHLVFRFSGYTDYLESHPSFCVFDFISIIAVGGSLLLYVLLRRHMIPPNFLLGVGLGFLIAGAAGIDIGKIWIPYPADFTPNGISWACVWIVGFSFIVPNPPRRMFYAGIAAASILPISIFLSIARGNPMLGAPVFVMWFLPGYVCAGIAAYGSSIVYSLSRDVHAARRMGSYRLVELLGRGGMGEVWRAHHRMLARPAAIKLISAASLGMEGQAAITALKRFEREAQATAALTSPHTVQLFDFGVTEDGTFYYVMELLDGVDLETLVKRFGPVAPERVARFLEQACDSLADAHDAGLIHRDIKPANVYVCRMGRRIDIVKVLDFGLVKSVGEAERRDARLTVEGVATGTPAYIAPEMAIGSQIDERTDLYSLGCVAYWLLTGQLVFEGRSPMQMIADHMQTIPEPPSARTELEIPKALEALVMACLEKDPNRRPPSAEELGRRLAELELATAWTEERARRWWETHLPTATTARPVDASEAVERVVEPVAY